MTAMGPAEAGVAQSTVVSENPVNYTPNLAADAITDHPAAYAVEAADGLTYLGGQFDAVQNADRTGTVIRRNFVAFDSNTGTISNTMRPTFDGSVWAIRYYNGSLYVVGDFTTVNGAPGHRGIVKIHPTTGAVDPGFRQPWSAGIGYDLRITGGRVIVAGTFGGALKALDPSTGADTGYLSGIHVTGTCVANPACGDGGKPGSNEPTHVYRIDVSNDGRHLAAIGNFVTPHPRAFVANLDATATLNSWYYPALAHSCSLPKSYPAYLRDVSFAPDGTWFAVAGTGYVPHKGMVGTDICDAAARFNLGRNSPVWINYTGGDTLHSVVVTGAAVYVQGHNRWLDNPAGRDSCMTTCVSRPGIGAINPTTGRALPWNPTKSRDVGGKDLLATTTGLWVTHDGTQVDHEYHRGVAYLPL